MDKSEILSFVILFLIIIIFSCSEMEKWKPLNTSAIFEYNSVKGEELINNKSCDLIQGNIPFVIANKKSYLNWVVYHSSDDQLAFSLPKSWEIKCKEGVTLFCDLKRSNNAYFAMLVHNKKSINLSLNGYLGVINDALSSDSIEVLVDYNINKVKLENRVLYLSSIETVKNNNKFLSYSCYTEDELNIYDFTIKKKKADMLEIDKVSFDLFLENITINNLRLIKNKNVKYKLEFDYN